VKLLSLIIILFFLAFTIISLMIIWNFTLDFSNMWNIIGW
jgi:hypothetical protein